MKAKTGHKTAWTALVVSVALVAANPCLAAKAAHASAPVDNSSYQIGPQDLLHISVWHEKGLDEDVLVRPDGGISFPLAGDMQAAGKTPAQLQAEITKRIQKYINSPVVSVQVKQVEGYKVYVLGKVNKPGEYMVGRYVDVMQALSLAGGLTPYASENNIKVIRKIGGTQKVFPFRYSQVADGERLDQNIVLKSGDTVVVP